jgi:hypothetical protein
VQPRARPFAPALPSTQQVCLRLRHAPERFQIDEHVGHGGEFRCLRYEEFLRVATDAQHFAQKTTAQNAMY